MTGLGAARVGSSCAQYTVSGARPYYRTATPGGAQAGTTSSPRSGSREARRAASPFVRLSLFLAVVSLLAGVANGAIDGLPPHSSSSPPLATTSASTAGEAGPLPSLDETLDAEDTAPGRLGRAGNEAEYVRAESMDVQYLGVPLGTAPGPGTSGSRPASEMRVEAAGSQNTPPASIDQAAPDVEEAPELTVNAVQLPDVLGSKQEPVMDGMQCNPSFQPVLSEMRENMNIRFSEDTTLNYLKLILPLRLTSAELCRVMLIRGSDSELIEICYSEVPRVDGESANAVLEIESRGMMPSQAICSNLTDVPCGEAALGCGLCHLDSTAAFLSSLGYIPAGRLCKETVQVDINHNFACIYKAILTAQRDLSQAYIDMAEPSSSVTIAAQDTVDLYEDNPVFEWMERSALTC